MAEDLMQMIGELSLLDTASPASLLVIRNVVSKCCDSYAALDVLAGLSGAIVNPVTYCYAFECMFEKSPESWLLPELAALIKQPVSNVNNVESVGTVVENEYKPCLCAAVSKLHDSAVVGTLANEENVLCDSPVAASSVSCMKALSALLCKRRSASCHTTSMEANK
jgi:hypothetical protein